eukprot:CAMPEP_0115735082 /NCGR_PEP_ID=MMETSP0272-20121206/86530_1 /TAXON_ID=71861 /ORGANISM="Scrippsiella trochoidea, Strain CCMP3099" /LENGTH=100 /DNA_ID=CAMNT_0003179165 /DNA_START=24 /DNA_END=327 /DNA_ORIENTATION=-
MACGALRAEAKACKTRGFTSLRRGTPPAEARETQLCERNMDPPAEAIVAALRAFVVGKMRDDILYKASAGWAQSQAAFTFASRVARVKSTTSRNSLTMNS